MITFDNLKKEIFGIGLTPEDIRAMRAGCSHKVRVNEDLEIVLFIGDDDDQMLRDLTTEEIIPVKQEFYARDGWPPDMNLRARGGKLISVRGEEKKGRSLT